MATVAEWLSIDGERVVQTLQEAGEKLHSTEGELILDFSSVHRIDASAIKTMEELAGKANEKNVKVILRSVNVDVYKVLKLSKLAPRFSFVS